MGTTKKVLVTERALIQRINRKLWHDDQVLRKTRGTRAQLDLGWFYVLDWRRNFVVEHDVDPESLGRELGVLAEYESLADG